MFDQLEMDRMNIAKNTVVDDDEICQLSLLCDDKDDIELSEIAQDSER